MSSSISFRFSWRAFREKAVAINSIPSSCVLINDLFLLFMAIEAAGSGKKEASIWLPFYIARSEGIYDSLGLDLTILPFNSANDRDAVFQTGQMDGMVTDYPSADRIAAFPSERGIAPSKTPCGQMYLQKNGSPIPIEFVISIGRRITKTIRMMYFRYLSGFNRAVESFFPGIF